MQTVPVVHAEQHLPLRGRVGQVSLGLQRHGALQQMNGPDAVEQEECSTHVGEGEGTADKDQGCSGLDQCTSVGMCG